MPWIEKRRDPNPANDVEFDRVWIDEDEYEEYLDEINEHCPICGRRLDEDETGLCPECDAKYTTIDWALRYQKESLPIATREVEIPALWADLLDDSVILAALEREFCKTLEMYKAYLPERLGKVARRFCLEDELYYCDWLNKVKEED